jgi:hypothetical protein
LIPLGVIRMTMQEPQPGLQVAGPSTILRAAWGVLAVIVVWLACGLPSLFWGFGRDQGSYAYQGSVVLHGGVPFKDVWETKGPGIQYIYTFAQILLGHNMWGIHLVDLLAQLLAALLLFVLVYRMAGVLSAVLGACLYLLYYYDSGFWHVAQCESFAVPLVLLGFLLTAVEPPGPRPGQCLIGGLYFGLLAWLKPHFILLAGAPVLALCLRRLAGKADPPNGEVSPKANPRWLARTGICFALGVLAGALTLILWALATGAWQPMKEIYLSFNRVVYFEAQPRSPLEHAQIILRFLTHKFLFLTLLAAVGAIVLLVRRRFEGIGLLLLGLLGLATVVMANKYFRYHWFMLLPAATALAGCAAAQVEYLGHMKTFKLRAVWGVVCAALFLVALYSPVKQAGRELVRVTSCILGASSWEDYNRRFKSDDFSFLSAKAAAEQVERSTSPGQPVLVWAYDSLIYYLANRFAPTRFAYPYPLGVSTYNELIARWRADFMNDMLTQPPMVIVVGREDRTKLVGKDSQTILDEFPSFKMFLVRNSGLGGTMDNYQVWRRIEGRAGIMDGERHD